MAYGTVRNPDTGLCLDTLGKEDVKPPTQAHARLTVCLLEVLGLYKCEQKVSLNQIFSLTKGGDLRSEFLCAEAAAGKGSVSLINCHYHKGDQAWRHDQVGPSASLAKKERGAFEGGALVHVASGLCLDAEGLQGGSAALLRQCGAAKATQRWAFARFPPES